MYSSLERKVWGECGHSPLLTHSSTNYAPSRPIGESRVTSLECRISEGLRWPVPHLHDGIQDNGFHSRTCHNWLSSVQVPPWRYLTSPHTLPTDKLSNPSSASSLQSSCFVRNAAHGTAFFSPSTISLYLSLSHAREYTILFFFFLHSQWDT